MKKPISVFVIILVAVVTYGAMLSYMAQSSVQAAASTVKLYVSPTSLSITAGQTGSVQLRLSKDSSAKVDYVDAKATFSSSNLEVVSISKQGSHFGYGNGPATSFNNSSGTLAVSGRGAELASKADVLVATVTFRGKSVGTGSLSYTSSSQAGDLTNGGHVKNSLTARVGGIIDISSPPASGGGSTPGGTTGGGAQPSTPPAEPTPTEQAKEVAKSPDTPTSSDEVPVSASSQDDSGSPNGVAATLEEAVTKPPVWMQFLVPGAAVVGVLGFVGLGLVLQRKRRQDGVRLPPSDEATGGTMMPSTEQAEGALGIPIPTTVTEEPFGLAEEPDLPEFSALRPMTPLSAPEPEAPMALESALEEQPVLMPAELMNVPSPEMEAPAAPPAPGPEPMSQPEPATPVAPDPASTPLASVEQQPVASDQAVSALPPAPTQPADMTAMQSLSQSSEAVQSPSPPALHVEPVQQPVEALASPDPAPPASAVPALQTTAAAQLSQTDNVDYANMPDMFDVGAQRLQNEGLANLGPVPR